MTNEEMFLMFSILIVAIVGFTAIICLLKYFIRKHKTKNCTFPVEGTLVRLDIKISGGGDTGNTLIYTPIFKYMYSGKEYEAKAVHDWLHTAWEWTYKKAGEKFTIYIDKDNPTHFVVPLPKVSKGQVRYDREWGKDGVWRDLTPEQKEEN